MEISKTMENSISTKIKKRNMSSSNPLLIYWHVYFNFGFYICIIPFRFKRNDLTGHFEFNQNRTQMVLTGIAHLLSFCIILIRFTPFHYGTEGFSWSPLGVLDIVLDVSELVYQITISYILWKKSSIFSAVFDKFQESDDLVRKISDSEKLYTHSYYRIVLAIIICGWFSLAPNLSIIEGLLQNGWDSVSLFEEYGFIDIVISYMRSSQSTLLILSTYISYIYYQIFGDFSYILVYLGVIMLYELLQEFLEILSGNFDAGYVLKEYKNLKEKAEKINEAMRLILLAYGIGATLFYIMYLSGGSGSELRSKLPVMYFIFSAGFLGLAASVNNRMETFKEWIQTHCHDISGPELLVILNELTPRSNKIGLKIGNLFCINYGFLGTLAGILLTYIIVISQMANSNSTNCSGLGLDKNARFCEVCNVTCFIK